MISHLGKMLSLVVGGTWAARRDGEDVFGLAVIGDGGTSTGEFHEALNLASVHKVARAVPDREQPLRLLHAHQRPVPLPAAFRSGGRLRHHAAGRSTAPIPGKSTRPCATRSTRWHGRPAAGMLECMSLRLHGHAAYDKGLMCRRS